MSDTTKPKTGLFARKPKGLKEILAPMATIAGQLEQFAASEREVIAKRNAEIDALNDANAVSDAEATKVAQLAEKYGDFVS